MTSFAPKRLFRGETLARPRILFFANGILGWKTYSHQLDAILQARDDIEVITRWRRPGRLATAIVKRHDAPGRLERLFRRVDPINAYRHWLGRDIRAAVRETAPDIVHFASHWPAAAMLTMLSPPPFTVALDATRRNMEADFGVDVWRAAELRAEADLLHRAERVFPMTEWVARSLRGDCRLPDDRITVVPPAQDLSRFVPPEAHGGIPNVIFIGNDFERKGGPRLVDWIRGPLAGSCHLHIVSADAGAVESDALVTVHGRVPHDRLIGELLPRMDVMCLPTELDMSPHVLVEAASAGIPAVATRSGGIPDLVIDGHTGLLITPGDDAGFIAALQRMIESAECRRQMGQAARIHARQRFDANIVLNAMIDEMLAIPGRAARSKMPG